jgi:hypothetical protein
MGSSDPHSAGFEIWFGSLNFQATGNGYLMRITNHTELHPWRLTGPGPVPPRLRRTLRALQHPDADGVLSSARARREWNDVRPHASRHEVTRLSARR